MALWIPLFTDFPSHPKTVKLRRALKLATAEAYVLRLWLWCAEHYPNGRPDLDLLEEACLWKGKPGALIAALRTAEYLDDKGSLPGWEGRAGAQLERINAKRRADRERKSQRGRAEVASKSRRPPSEVATQTEKEKEKEKESTSYFVGSTGVPPARADEGSRQPDGGQPRLPGAPVPAKPAPRGLSAGAAQLVAYLDFKLRARDPALALPAKLSRADAVIANCLASENDPARLKYTVWWAFQDGYWQQNIAGLQVLAGAWKKLIAQSAKTWQELQHEREVWDEPVPERAEVAA